MKPLYFGFFILIIVFLFFITFRSNKKPKGLKQNKVVDQLSSHVESSRILSEPEIAFYRMLEKACPKNIVLCQVSFNAFLKCSNISVRNKFNRSMCDFMIVDSEFEPILCLELDDRSHLSDKNTKRDEFRDNLLSAAEIPTIRFYGVPSQHALKSKLKDFIHVS